MMLNRWGLQLIDRLVIIAMTLAALILTLYLALMPLAFNRAFFHEQFLMNNSSLRANMSIETLDEVMDHVLKYLEDENDDMQIMIETLDQETVAAFRERELQHMVDVKNLFLEGRRIARISLFFLAAALAYLAFRQKHISKTWAKIPLYTLITFVGVVAAIGIFAAIDFYRVFELFHHLLFTNDLWLLDYNDLLIIMLPESLFSTIAFRTLTVFAVAIIAAIILLSIFLRRQKQRLLHLPNNQ